MKIIPKRLLESRGMNHSNHFFKRFFIAGKNDVQKLFVKLIRDVSIKLGTIHAIRVALGIFLKNSNYVLNDVERGFMILLRSIYRRLRHFFFLC